MQRLSESQFSMFQGFVYRNTSNSLCAKVIPAGDPIPATAADIIFLGRSEDEGKIQACVDAVCQIAQQIAENGKFLTVPPATSSATTTPGEYYVYAYTRAPEAALARWTDCFYIGKGRNKRWIDHIKQRADNAAKGIPPKGDKETAIQSWINRLPEFSSKELAKKAAGSFVRKVGAWRGGYAEIQSYVVEYFLIAHHLGPHAISNGTGGYMENDKVYALARPAIFDQDNAIHKAYWEGTVDEFCKFPQTKNNRSLWKPALLLLHAEKMIDQLDAQLASVDITPHDMHNNGRLSPEMMLRPHCQVDGSGDATINYSMPSQSPYRLQLKLSATTNEVRINMRPQQPGAAASQEFQDYIDNLAMDECEAFGCRVCIGPLEALYGEHDPIKDRDGKPFFKPFAQDARGARSPWFDIADTKVLSKVSTTNWIEGEISLALIEAMVLIFDVFRHPEAKSQIVMSA